MVKVVKQPCPVRVLSEEKIEVREQIRLSVRFGMRNHVPAQLVDSFQIFFHLVGI